MNAQVHDLELILRRISALERQNYWLTRGGVAVALLAIVMVTMAQVRPSRTIEAEKFVLRDESGRTRAELSFFNGDPLLAFYDPDGKRTLGLSGEVLSLRKSGANGKAEIRLEVGTSVGPVLEFKNDAGILQAGLSQEGLVIGKPTTPEGFRRLEIGSGHVILTDESGHKSITLSADGPSVNVVDKEGFRAAIGTTNLTLPNTGETRRTSAASIALFDNENKRIWSAP